jgi:hypothetical protein
MTAPVESKVAAAASASAITGVITWILVTYVPTLHGGLPASLATFLPFVVASAIGAISGYMAPHTPRAVSPPETMPAPLWMPPATAEQAAPEPYVAS